jgi:hypothetical protein
MSATIKMFTPIVHIKYDHSGGGSCQSRSGYPEFLKFSQHLGYSSESRRIGDAQRVGLTII